jgi:hypothetical protein
LLGAQVFAHLFDARELVGQFLNGSDFGLLVDRDVGLADVRKRAFQMGADEGVCAVLMQAGAQGTFGGSKPREQHVAARVKGAGLSGIHGCSSESG